MTSCTTVFSKRADKTLHCFPCFALLLPSLLGSRDVYHSQVGLAPSGNCRLVLLLVVIYSQREAVVVSTPFLHILRRSQLKFAKCFWLPGHQLSAGAESRKLVSFIFVTLPSFLHSSLALFPTSLLPHLQCNTSGIRIHMV